MLTPLSLCLSGSLEQVEKKARHLLEKVWLSIHQYIHHLSISLLYTETGEGGEDSQ